MGIRIGPVYPGKKPLSLSPWKQGGNEKMQAYLFVHFREKTTPDGEQVYFGVSKDGFNWEEVNGGAPVLWAYYGDKGVRDFTVVRCKNPQTGKEKFVILATDLSLSYGMRGQYHHSWDEIGHNGSKSLAIWESDDLVNWTEQRLAKIGDEQFGCLWAPDVIYDKKAEDYVVHWSSSHARNNYGEKAIFYSRTKDFKEFSKPEILYEWKEHDIIDSALYEEDGSYYLFVKCGQNPARILLLRSDEITGPYTRIEAFDKSMETIEEGKYEAATAVKLEDNRWCLFLDYYGVPGAGQGYVPFVADSLASGNFIRSDAAFSFPYGFKHGTILKISMEEYQRIKDHDWSDKGWQ